ncbi:macro domain-containing protein [Pleionea litopenaei]|uniref:Macro domain-containing protein n=1 Tax=Pleionea litopenaei TaxID=3070815 RepID=A0AA51RR35_9GAMM|nr:macro domain-containing protein [Pleionea sp. HL-JVS1]WMS85909.1 macro domain-containing protein [Pleionea sp. HL-JVS1]
MKIIDGNLLDLAEEGMFDVIIHGCNCFCNMGSGIAKQIKERYPEAFQADLATIKGDENKLGSFTFARVKRQTSFVIVNAYTQYAYGRKGCFADYDALARVFVKIKQSYQGRRIAYPLIGAGLAKGDWSIIEPIIDNALKGEDHTLVRYSN